MTSSCASLGEFKKNLKQSRFAFESVKMSNQNVLVKVSESLCLGCETKIGRKDRVGCGTCKGWMHRKCHIGKWLCYVSVILVLKLTCTHRKLKL